MKDDARIPAATYLRMSTDRQQYRISFCRTATGVPAASNQER